MKWKTLEHHGVIFPEAYQPLPKHVRMKNKETGEAIELPVELEEPAVWWAME